MKLFTRTSLVLGCLLCQACSTINFVQYQQAGEQKQHHRWHHMAINGMVEISKPLDLQEICGKRTWNKVSSEYSFYNWLAGVAVPSIPYVVLYTPFTNTVECFEPRAKPAKTES